MWQDGDEEYDPEKVTFHTLDSTISSDSECEQESVIAAGERSEEQSEPENAEQREVSDGAEDDKSDDEKSLPAGEISATSTPKKRSRDSAEILDSSSDVFASPVKKVRKKLCNPDFNPKEAALPPLSVKAQLAVEQEKLTNLQKEKSMLNLEITNYCKKKTQENKIASDKATEKSAVVDAEYKVCKNNEKSVQDRKSDLVSQNEGLKTHVQRVTQQVEKNKRDLQQQEDFLKEIKDNLSTNETHLASITNKLAARESELEKLEKEYELAVIASKASKSKKDESRKEQKEVC